MTPFGRVLLRLVVVPLGALAAVCASVVVLVLLHWQALASAFADPALTDDQMMAAFILAPAALFMLISSGVTILLPAAVGVVVAEAFAVRSVLYHVGNGGLAAGLGWLVSQGGGAGGSAAIAERLPVYGDPRFVVAAGLAAGFVYWAVAGWNAGLRAPAAPGAAR